MMKTVYGDLLEMADDGDFDVIVHGCNCFCVMGAGIALQIANKWPEVLETDKETETGDLLKLGLSTFVAVNDEKLVVVNGYTQFQPGANVDYSAIRSVFSGIKKSFSGQRIGYPMIGAGIAGGDWEMISSIIETELEGEDHTLVVYQK